MESSGAIPAGDLGLVAGSTGFTYRTPASSRAAKKSELPIGQIDRLITRFVESPGSESGSRSGGRWSQVPAP
jgi:hypothetical protein